MNIKEFFKLLKMDVHRYGFEGESKKAFLLSPSMMITFWLRIGSWLQSKKNLFAKIAIIPVKIIYKFNALLTGIQFPIGTQLFWGGIRFKHYSGIVIAGSVVVGENCTIHHDVTIGRVFNGKKSGVPTLEDHVVIFPGAKIIGNVHIGSHAVIGTNAVVINDVPPYAVVAGNPANVVSVDNRKCFDEYWSKAFDF